MTEKERYATCWTWSQIFRKEGVYVSSPVIKSRLKEAGIIGKTARERMGHISRAGFYAESDVRRLVADLLVDVPRANRDGTFEKDGESYATIPILGDILRISPTTVEKRLKERPLEPVRGKGSNGHLCIFYALSEIRTLCADLVEDIPQAGEDGTFEKDGETYGTKEALSRYLLISSPTIWSRLGQGGLQPIPGRTQKGQRGDFYPLSVAQRVCQDLLDFPLVGSNGNIEKDGETYATLRGLSKLIGISETAIRTRIRESSLVPIQAKSLNGRIRDFYALSEIRTLCADLVEDIPQAGEDGTFEKGGMTYGTINSLSRLLGVRDPTIRSRILKGNLKPIQGKDQGGHILNFYPFSEVRKLCADLIAKRKKSDD